MKYFLTKHIHIFFASLCIVFFIVLHSYQITQTPAGLYLDETSIGLNAATISETGTDEYGQKFPIYFQAFGEWKNPLYIYTSALIFKIFGISECNLRMTSIFFFAIFLLGICFFTRKLFPKNISVLYYSLFAAGTLPWFFTLSRISFEVISQIAMAIWLFYFLYLSYNLSSSDEASAKTHGSIPQINIKTYIYPIISGLFLALFLYSYSTSRVLAFGIILALLLSFYQKKYWKTHIFFILSFLGFILPYIYFSYENSGALTARFELLTYLYFENLSVLEKISLLLKNYFSAFDISSFLLFQGDLNIRHSSGFMGQIFFIPFILFLVGISGIIQNIFSQKNKNSTDEKNKEITDNQSKKSWKIFLFLVFLGSPLPASLTSDIHHSLRLLFFGLMIFIFSIYGYTCIIEKLRDKKIIMRIVSGIIFLGIFFQSIFYFQNYFSDIHKEKTIAAFGGYELQEAIEWAEKQSPTKIIFYENSRNPLYASINFYNHVLGIKVQMNTSSVQKNMCQLWYKWNIPHNKISAKKYFVGDENGIVRGACY